MTTTKKDPIFSMPLAWDDPDFEGKDVSLKDYNVVWHECVANEAIANMLFSDLTFTTSKQDSAFLDKVTDFQQP